MPRPPWAGPYNRVINVLFLCTGNICRSPMAEAMMRRSAADRGVPARIASAGRAYDDHEASEGSVRAMRPYGLDLTNHQSRIMWPELLESADLIVAMARSHVREAAVMAPDVFGRVFTLKELVRRGHEVGPRGDQPLETWLEKVAIGRDFAKYLGTSTEDDVEDPIGRSQRYYDAAAAEITDLVGQLADLVWGPVPAGDGRPS